MAENSKNVPVIIEIGELYGTINIDIPMSVWRQSVTDLADEVLNDIADSEEDEEDEKSDTFSGYIDSDGRSHDCNTELADIAVHLMNRGVDVVGWLDSCNMLENLRSTLTQCLEQDPQTQEQAELLKNAEDTLTAFRNWWYEVSNESESKQVVFVECEFPQELLKDIYSEVKSR